MKKALLLCALLCAISGCGAKTDETNIRSYFEEMPSYDAHIKLISDLDQSVVEYELDYAYNKEGSDTFTITAPEALKGIGGTIAGENSGVFTLQFNGASFDDAMPQTTGLTPADALFCLMSDLRTEVPTQQWTERVNHEPLMVLRYEMQEGDEKVAKQIWLTEKNLQPVCAEIYANDERVLLLQFVSYQPRT